jgi:hypothetical protein
MFTNNNFIFGNKKKTTNNHNNNQNYNPINIEPAAEIKQIPIPYKSNEYIVQNNEFPSELDSSFNSATNSTKSSESSEYKSEEKKYWEYGNRGVKMKNFNKKMSRNLAIMYYIDRVFIEWIDKSLSNNYELLFNPTSSLIFTLKSGQIHTENNQVIVKPLHDKISGSFRVLDAGYVQITDIELTDKDLFKNNIPNIDSIIKHKDNIVHMIKILNIFNIPNKFRVKESVSDKQISFHTISLDAINYIDELKASHNKKTILKSDKNTGFYIKIYNNRAKAFFLDTSSNLIHYIGTNINFNERFVSIRYYTFELIGGKIKKK